MENEAVENFQKLLQFNSVNPPGNEVEIISFLEEKLKSVGYEPKVIEAAPRRRNLVVRYKGTGAKKPLLINSHVDVVGVEESKWKYPPFSGTIAEDCIWGRGAIDMKNMTAFCLATMLHLKRQNIKLSRDIIMTAVADEEVGGFQGMGYLLKHHPDLIQCEYALGELGGYTLYLNGKRFYPIQVAEKGIYQIKVTFKGEPGHGSYPKINNVNYEMGRFLQALAQRNMPFHLTTSAKLFLDGIAKAMGPLQALNYKALQTPLGISLLKSKQKKHPDNCDQYAAIAGMLSNTVNPTGLEAGKQVNVVPGHATVTLDCRVLPGFTGDDVRNELEKLWGNKLNVEVLLQAPASESSTETELYKLIETKVKKYDEGSFPVPMLITGFTDGQYLKKLGCQYYGFTPVKLPPGMVFPQLYHGHNERVPVEGFKWGLRLFMETVLEFCT